MSPEAGERAGGPEKRSGTWMTDAVRAGVFLGAVVLLVRFGEELSLAALATPIIVVASVALVWLLISEFRAYRRWTLH